MTDTLAELMRKRRTLIDQINKKFKGWRAIDDVGNVPNPFQLRRPSGIMQLDIDTGGGLPAGGICYLSGPDGAGKTWLLYNYFAMHQKIYGNKASILYAPVEFLHDHKQMRRIGCQVAIPERMLEEIDTDRIARRLPKLTKQERAALRTQVGVVDVLRTETAEELLDSLLAAYKSNVYHIIAVDSVSVLQASAEAVLNTLADNPQQAANATLLTRFMQRYHPLTLGLSKEPLTGTVIFTAQVRANRHKSELPSYMAKWEKDWATTGGANAMKHGKLIDAQLWSEGKDKEVGPNKTKVTIGKTVKWLLVKGKAGTNDNITGEYSYRYSAPGDHIPALVSTGVQYGAAVLGDDDRITFLDKQTGEALPTRKGTKLADIKGLQGLRDLLESEPDAEFTIRREILAAAGVGTCLYK
jgi:RecA/RadA recombinase